jgi:hypothetical protein
MLLSCKTNFTAVVSIMWRSAIFSVWPLSGRQRQDG